MILGKKTLDLVIFLLTNEDHCIVVVTANWRASEATETLFGVVNGKL